jgi:hypothetical protein
VRGDLLRATLPLQSSNKYVNALGVSQRNSLQAVSLIWMNDVRKRSIGNSTCTYIPTSPVIVSFPKTKLQVKLKENKKMKGRSQRSCSSLLSCKAGLTVAGPFL